MTLHRWFFTYEILHKIGVKQSNTYIICTIKNNNEHMEANTFISFWNDVQSWINT